jgi:hypothetical protein
MGRDLDTHAADLVLSAPYLVEQSIPRCLCLPVAWQAGLTSKGEVGVAIKRYLHEHEVERLNTEARFLVDTVLASKGELFLALRHEYTQDIGYLNIYSRGNSLAKIVFQKRGNYGVEISREFFGTDEETRAKRLPKFLPELRRDSSNRYLWTVDAKQLHSLLQRANIRTLMHGIRHRDFAEEIWFEQTLIADNLGREDFIIIDRQVDEPNDDRGRLDLLALERVGEVTYRFVPLEVKLGNNPELAHDVKDQIQRYVDRIEERFEDYRACYELAYAQLRSLGLISAGPAGIHIVRGTEGMVVVGGYAGLAREAIAELHDHAPDIRVKRFFNSIDRGTD